MAVSRGVARFFTCSPVQRRCELGKGRVRVSVQFVKGRSKRFPVEERVDVGADGAIEGIPHDGDAEPPRPRRARGQVPWRGQAAFGLLEDFVRVSQRIPFKVYRRARQVHPRQHEPFDERRSGLGRAHQQQLNGWIDHRGSWTDFPVFHQRLALALTGGRLTSILTCSLGLAMGHGNGMNFLGMMGAAMTGMPC